MVKLDSVDFVFLFQCIFKADHTFGLIRNLLGK